MLVTYPKKNPIGASEKDGMVQPAFSASLRCELSKKSPTGRTERTPKPGYLIAPATYLGVRW